MEIVFEQTQRTKWGEVIIGVRMYNADRPNASLYFKDIEEARNHERLMKDDMWAIDSISEGYAFPVFEKVTEIVLYFKDDIVEKFEFVTLHMT